MNMTDQADRPDKKQRPPSWDKLVSQLQAELEELGRELERKRKVCADYQAKMTEHSVDILAVEAQIADKQTVLQWCKAQQSTP